MYIEKLKNQVQSLSSFLEEFKDDKRIIEMQLYGKKFCVPRYFAFNTKNKLYNELCLLLYELDIVFCKGIYKIKNADNISYKRRYVIFIPDIDFTNYIEGY